MISAEDVRMYTEARCWVLAWHLNQLLPDTLIMDFDEHVLVQLGPDRYLDVTGIHTKAELAQVWEKAYQMRPISYDLGRYILEPDAPENVHALAVARALITTYLSDR